jgi:hypothetical protein
MSADQIKFYVIPAVLYALVASPATYRATRGVLGGWVASSEGTARLGGLILHAIVFILLATLAMRYFPSKRSGYNHPGAVSQQEGMGTKLVEVPHMLAPAPY